MNLESPFSDDYAVQQQAMIQQLQAACQARSPAVSIVPMCSDYEHNAELALTAVTLPSSELAQQITTQVIEPLRAIAPEQFYYPNDGLHLTIKNVRKMHNPPRFTAADAQRVNAQFQQIIPSFPTFSIQLQGLLQLPTSISLLGYSSRVLGDLVQALDRGLAAIDLADDKQYISNTVFFGNITVCRFTQAPSAALQAKIQALSRLEIGEFPVKTIQLVTCNCVCSASTRQVIGRYALMG